MKPSFLVFCSGVIFGMGLAVSGMLNPSKVVGFLDLFGEWDPSLAFVMGGGMVVNFIGVGWAMAGLCPGPAIASVLLNPANGVLFLGLMCAGLGAGRLLARRLDR
jgi:uncharacterized membrane protein YedE/YeeE